MELATSIRIEDGIAVATAVSPEHATLNLTPMELATRGLPVGFARRSVGAIKTDLSTWRPVNFDEYAFGVERPVDGAEHAHDAWAFVHGNRRYVVPALALMRSIVEADAELFRRLFQAQSLEDICSPRPNDDDPDLRFTLNERLKEARKRVTPALPALMGWFYSFPSARRFWASAYLSAKQGRLGLTLPKASLTFTVHGAHFRTNFNVYVTRILLSDIEPLEEPVEFASNHPRSIALRPALTKAEQAQDVEPDHSGRLDISDDAWRAVEPLLARTRGRGPNANNRSRLNCVLQVLVGGSTWSAASRLHQCPLSSGAEALARWKQDGRWSAVSTSLRSFGYSV